MEQITEDLWPADIGGVPTLTTPVSILKEQAVLLGRKTKNLVQVEVTSGTIPSSITSGAMGQDRFHHSFWLVAPALDYRYTLFKIKHEITLYPLDLEWESKMSVSSEAELKDQLKKIFASDKTKKIIQSMIAQSQA